MTERKGLLPKVTQNIANLVNRENYEDPHKYLKEEIEKFKDNKDYMFDFVLKHGYKENYQSIGFALTVYRMLGTASKEQRMGELPVITKDIADLVEKESAQKKDSFAYEMIERLREDNGVIADSIDEMLNETNDLQSILPATEMYRMLEIASEKQLINQTNKQKYLH